MQNQTGTSMGAGERFFTFSQGPWVSLSVKWAPGWLAIVGTRTLPAAPGTRWEWLRLHLQPGGPAPNHFRAHIGARMEVRELSWLLRPAFSAETNVFDEVLIATGAQVVVTEAEHACLRDVLVTASHAALEGIDAHHLALARRFASDDRLHVLRALHQDRTGRLVQLAQSCPALLALALSPSAAPSDVLARAVAGEPLRDVIDAQIRATWRREPSPALRHWLRSAPAEVPASVLEDFWSESLIASDIPESAQERSGWYAMMSSAAEVVNEMRSGSSRVQRAFLDFVSRHGARLSRRLYTPVHRLLWARAALAYCESQNLAPGRNRALEPFCAKVAEFRRRLKKATRDGALVTIGPPPAGPPRGRALRAVPIESLAQLAQEGKTMKHCVADMAVDVIAGRSFFYAVRASDERLTLQLVQRNGVWRFEKVQGTENAEASLSARRSLRSWLEREGIAVAGLVTSSEDADDEIPF